jgi:CrcB protein
MAIYLWIALGSALGGVSRHAASQAILAQVGANGLPWWTILVNVTGSFAIGWVAGTADMSPDVRLFLTTGVLGGYTTFSAFSLQTLELFQRGDWTGAALNVALSVILCLAGVWLGFRAA